jgi:tRNA nucleotidyltransferase (CCA-adding enzyme)
MRADAEALAALCSRLRVPQECADLALLAARHQRHVAAADGLDAAGLLSLLQALDALRRPQRFQQWLAVIEWDAGAVGLQRLRMAQAAAQAVDAGAIARAQTDPAQIREAVAAAREAAIAAALSAVR